ncbi:MAG TPA: Nramp family divalent metal transporter, partial [Candidatus Polarisedimenticolaceae bacterium]|nr:Nramp family divalent metal transporter [Candidatus Polarisedimenticolaceae bacterium]
ETAWRAIGEASLPPGSARFVLGVIGGVGGSVTLLSYAYWIDEKGWSGPDRLTTVRVDLRVAYLLTGIFAVAVMSLAAVTLHPAGTTIQGNSGALVMADMLVDVVGPLGRWIFLVGFWGAVATSMLGVWQGIPYLFCDFVALMRGLAPPERRRVIEARSPWYRGYVVFLALPPLGLLAFGRPVALVVVYSVLGALFMPFLAATLLYMNSRPAWVGSRLRNGVTTTLLLVLCLVLFTLIAAVDVSRQFD